MIRWLLVTLAWRPDGVSVAGVDLYATEAICDTMGAIARAWFGVDWGCVLQVFV